MDYHGEMNAGFEFVFWWKHDFLTDVCFGLVSALIGFPVISVREEIGRTEALSFWANFPCLTLLYVWPLHVPIPGDSICNLELPGS